MYIQISSIFFVLFVYKEITTNSIFLHEYNILQFLLQDIPRIQLNFLLTCIPVSFQIVSEVPDLVCQEYTIPTHQINIAAAEQGFSQTTRAPPPILNFLPKPPPVPPPPEGYYVQRDLCAPLPLTPSPPLSPPSAVLNRWVMERYCYS